MSSRSIAKGSIIPVCNIFHCCESMASKNNSFTNQNALNKGIDVFGLRWSWPMSTNLTLTDAVSTASLPRLIDSTSQAFHANATSQSFHANAVSDEVNTNLFNNQL